MTERELHIDEGTAADVSSQPADTSDQIIAKTRLTVFPGVVAGGLVLGVVLAVCTLVFAPELRDVAYRWWPGPRATNDDSESILELNAEARRLEVRVNRLRAKLKSYLPRSAYLVVSTSDNRFELYSKSDLIREGICSTGSYVLLQGSDGKEWMFETPRGVFRVQDKRVKPVWSKPDWAFIEEGLPVPPPGAPERYERGALGDYALAIGNGYLIHGTLYQRMLGQPVTHGCIRLGDEDLETVFHRLSLGGRVFIY